MDSMSEAFDQMQMVKMLANSDKVSEVLQESTHQFNLLTSPTSYQREARHCWSLQRPTTSIMFGDATSKSPLGVFKNYHLKIGECIIQTDLTVMEMEEEKDLPLLGTPFLSTVGASIDFHKQEVILHKVVKERLKRNQELGRIRMREDQGLRSHVLRGLELRNHDLIGHELIGLVQAPCVLDEESLQALFDEPLGRALKEGEDAASKARPGDKRKIHQLRPLHSSHLSSQ
ncbi:unnamed protein product [Microthlaspi erraticum]|uniref:Aspartic peptidase DDI1-type domain-containing protein n=1 Tax=Microthlaspi erraticum TaxID=1685480 RepID=A0A6D2K826_9BRAS|nr:unnamed protein product [Microthlaspi erraticum]